MVILSGKKTISKKLSENMYRSFVRETNSMLNTRLKNQSLSTSQVSTQQNQPGSNYTTTEEAEVNPPAVPLTQDLGEAPPQVEPIQPQDSPILRQISILMEMIHMLQGQITTLTSQVNELVCQAASTIQLLKRISLPH